MAVMWRVHQLSHLWTVWQIRDDGLCLWTLSFESPEQEGGFADSRKATLVRQVTVLAFLTFLGAGMMVLLDVVTRPGYLTSDHRLTHTAQLIGIAMIAGSAIALVLALQCRCLRQRVSTPMLEIAVTSMCCTLMCVLVLTQPLYLSKLLNHDIVKAYGPEVYTIATDSAILLIIDGIVTASHLGLDIRWKALFFTEVVGIFLYAFIVFAVGSFEHNAHFNLALLVLLVAAAAAAKRSAETKERKSFLDILKERTLRCQAEFQLSSQVVRSEARPESIPDSLPTTTATGRVFEALHADGADVKESLEQVKTMGLNEHWLINEQEVALLTDQVLGVGGFGVVMQGIFCGMQVAVKMSHHVIQGSDLPKVSDMCNELRVLRRLRHRNIVSMLGAIVDVRRHRVALVLELVQGVRLDSFVAASPQCSSSEMPEAIAVYQLILGMCHALIYIHSRSPHIVHGDLKPRNIVVEISGTGAVRPRLLDFGLSRVLTRGPRALGGTLAWMAPEVCRGTSPACSADVYSFGHLIAFVATGKQPMHGLSRIQMIECLERATPPMPAWPAGCPFEHALKSQVARCLDVTAASRPSMKEVHSEILQQMASLRMEGEAASFLQEELMAAGCRQGTVDRSPAEAQQQAAEPPEAEQPAAAGRAPEAPLPGGETPTGAGAAAVGEEEEEEAAARAADAVALGVPLMPTSKASMMLSLCETLCRWHVPAVTGACCPDHGRARAARDLCLAMLDSPCGSQPLACVDVEGVQCPGCGILGVDPEGRCDMCQHSVGLPGRPGLGSLPEGAEERCSL